MAEPIGSLWLREKFDLGWIDLAQESFLGGRLSERVSVGSAERSEKTYPKDYDPGADPLRHVEFALKHEGVNLPLLQGVFRKLSQDDVMRFVRATPSGRYTRQVGFFYEMLAGPLAIAASELSGNYVPILDPDRFVTAAVVKNQRWRVDDNLLGGPAFCPTVRLTRGVAADVARSWKDDVSRALAGANPDTLNRALGYLYLKETRSSYLIEREEPGPQREEKFVNLLRSAGRAPTATLLSEQNLVSLQNVIVEPRYAQQAYRTTQNYVADTLPGLRPRVHYIPPPPDRVRELMVGLQASGQRLEAAPVGVHAAVVAFQFVFVHPFEDGNGRLHRFLLHDTLVRRGVLQQGAALPLSAAILSDMAGYDAALEDYSGRIMGAATYELTDTGELKVGNPALIDPLWRYPDLTAQVQYFHRIMNRALEQVPAELRFLEKYDRARKAVAGVVDMPDKRLGTLLSILHANGGRLSQNKRGLFAELSDEEVHRMEAVYRSATLDEMPALPQSSNSLKTQKARK